MIRSCMKPAPIGLLPLVETTTIADNGLAWKFMEINGKKALFIKKITNYNIVLYVAYQCNSGSTYRNKNQFGPSLGRNF